MPRGTVLRIRLNDEESADLDRRRGSQTASAFVRNRLFGTHDGVDMERFEETPTPPPAKPKPQRYDPAAPFDPYAKPAHHTTCRCSVCKP